MDFKPIPMTALRTVPRDAWRPPSGIRVISADDHHLEADHLWEERLPSRWKDKAPKYWVGESGVHMEAEGRVLSIPGLPAESERCPGFRDIDAKLRDMDAEGIEASLLYTGRAAGLFGLQDTELFWACMDVYNEWLAEVTRPHANRLVGVAVLPTYLRPEATADYISKLKDWGFRALQLPCAPRGVRYNSRAFDPMWKAIAESGIPLSFHVALQMPFSGYGSMGANLATILCPYRPLLAQLVFAGILDRFPDLKIVFTEGGASWAATAISDMDYICKVHHGRLNPKLGELPSVYWHRQCYTSFMYDPTALDVLDRLGEDNILWSADYPHAESTFSFSGEVMNEVWQKAGPARGAKILGGNAARLWGI